jgi:hypothetical protein
MKSFRIVLALGVLVLSSAAAQAKTVYLVPPETHSCGPHSSIGQIIFDLHGHKPCTVSVPEPATLGLLGIGLIGLAVKRRRK